MNSFRSLVFVLPLLATGCATLLQGGDGHRQQVQIDSDPSGATFYVDDQPQGSTPTRVTLDTRHDHQVRIEQIGYAPFQGEFTRGVNHKIWGNFALLGLAPAGFGVDLLSGSAGGLHPREMQATLTRQP